ncbi:MAG: carboxypeptidase-like regulatory domain-containing protein, partial [Bacteroidales bacterium]|nr:carboxypeptidase-like regulatory domain-containing protein [Bacteroidales bacterium]
MSVIVEIKEILEELAMKKTLWKYPIFALFFLFSSLPRPGISSAASLNEEMRYQDTLSYYTVTGRVRDASNRSALGYATLSVENSGIGVVSNMDGRFSLKIPVTKPTARVIVSYVGYKKFVIDVSPSSQELDIMLEVSPVQISEVLIRPDDASSIVAEALRRIPQNYSRNPSMMIGFYRESIKKNSNYVSLVEAILDIYKSGYGMSIGDQVRIYKGRKGSDKERVDTILFKFQGGVSSALDLDFIKHPDILFTEEPMRAYVFTLGVPIMLNDRSQYTIIFSQNRDVRDVLFRGKLFIDMETYAITRAEFNMNVEDNPLAQSLFIRRKPAGFNLKPVSAAYIMDFRQQSGKWYYNYSRTEVHFSTKWNKRLFRSNYTIQSEMAVTERYMEGLQRFPIEERLRTTDVIA